MEKDFIHSTLTKPDNPFERSLRPEKIEDFVGQSNICQRLSIFLKAAMDRNEAIGHCLFSGPPGLGKTTLANIIAKSMNSNIVTTSGPSIEKPGDLAGILTSLKERDVFFVDEIHRLPKNVEEYLYSAMEDYKLDLMIDSGVNARSVQINLSHFSLIGATTRSGLLSGPMRSRFIFNARLDYYSPKELQQIILRSAQLINIEIEEKGSLEIASKARGTPRIANNLLRWVRDYSQIHKHKVITKSVAKQALDMLSIDNMGLDEMDKKILSTIINHYEGGPVGIQTLGVALGEEPSTIAEVYEPYLIIKGFLKRTLRGRGVTKLAYEHMGYPFPEKNHGETS